MRTRLPGPSCPFPDTQKSARSPDNVPVRLPTGPIPLRLPSHLPGSSGGTAFCFFFFSPLPLSPPPVITSTAGPLLFYLFIPPSSPGGTGAEKRPTGEKGKPTPAEPAAARPQRRGSAPPASSTRDFRAAVPPHTHFHQHHRHRHHPPGHPGPCGQRADPGQNNGGQRQGEGRGAGGGRPVAGTAAGPSRLCRPFSAAPATPGARRSAEEITVRSITCQTLNWIGYFYPPPPFVTDSVHITNSESPIGIIRIEPFCKSC